VINLITIEHGIIGKDILKKFPQFGNVPLPVTQVIDEIPDSFLGVRLEGIVEALVCRDNLQIGIQHHKRLVHGFHDIFGVFAGILNFRPRCLKLLLNPFQLIVCISSSICWFSSSSWALRNSVFCSSYLQLVDL